MTPTRLTSPLHVAPVETLSACGLPIPSSPGERAELLGRWRLPLVHPLSPPLRAARPRHGADRRPCPSIPCAGRQHRLHPPTRPRRRKRVRAHTSSRAFALLARRGARQERVGTRAGTNAGRRTVRAVRPAFRQKQDEAPASLREQQPSSSPVSLSLRTTDESQGVSCDSFRRCCWVADFGLVGAFRSAAVRSVSAARASRCRGFCPVFAHARAPAGVVDVG